MNDTLLKRSIMLRMVIIGFLTIAMLIPSFLIMGLVSEREETRDKATADVSEKWGGKQTIAGPMLTLPLRNSAKEAQLLPESVSIVASTSPEVRYRGIYQVILYNAIAELRGKFSLEGLAVLNIKPEDVAWEEASLTIGISDLPGVNESVKIQWAGKEYTAEPGITGGNTIQSGISIKPVFSAGQHEYEFQARLNVNGSNELQFVPSGKETNVMVSSPWTAPSFVGRFLPDERTVGDDGFSAKWNVLHLNRNFPQQWINDRSTKSGGEILLEPFSFGVKLISPIDGYQQTMRSAKYAIMFIALTFLAFFLTEVFTRKACHPVHYALIGFSLVLFYCLLLSLSEHMAFSTAYAISGIAIVGLIGGYSRSVLGTTRFAVTISTLLALLYAFLFVILQQEDYALLFGSIGLFVVLALVMYLTRKIDWYTVGKTEGTAQ